ncbi:hypothetical protein FSARC_3445 [Fusarium sarcochroum]|uniref:Uncharacterized protein n=1 Tax=Fusarium sarcochroum TaxID=1208366 RepID=A0A8H4XCG4_9HYPO|nr:hypothetical protein FSARC_3445 [Fusarium sarcochroum]
MAMLSEEATLAQVNTLEAVVNRMSMFEVEIRNLRSEVRNLQTEVKMLRDEKRDRDHRDDNVPIRAAREQEEAVRQQSSNVLGDTGPKDNNSSNKDNCNQGDGMANPRRGESTAGFSQGLDTSNRDHFLGEAVDPLVRGDVSGSGQGGNTSGHNNSHAVGRGGQGNSGAGRGNSTSGRESNRGLGSLGGLGDRGGRGGRGRVRSYGYGDSERIPEVLPKLSSWRSREPR